MPSLPRRLHGPLLDRVAKALTDCGLGNPVDLAKDTGMPFVAAQQFLAAKVQPIFVLRWTKAIQPLVGIPLRELVNGLLDQLEPKSSTGQVTYRVVYERLLLVGWGVGEMAKALGLPEKAVLNSIRHKSFRGVGLIPALAKWLGIPAATLQGIQQQQQWRSAVPTAELDQTPLWVWIWDAVFKSGQSVSVWASANGFSRRRILPLAAGHKLDVSSPGFIDRLAKAIHRQPERVKVAFRVQLLNPIEEIPGGAYQVAEAIERKRTHGSAAEAHQSGSIPIRDLAQRVGVHHTALTRIVQTCDISGVNADVRERIRRYLRIEPLDWVRMVSTPKSDPAPMTPLRSHSKSIVTGDEEVTLLRLWRRANLAQQRAVLDILSKKSNPTRGDQS